MKRGYFVADKDEVYGVAVVALSARQAKKLAFDGELMNEVDWIDLRVTWRQKAKVDDLPVGIIKDDMLAVRCGVYSWLEGGVCDICHESGYVQSYNGQAVCSDCLESEA